MNIVVEDRFAGGSEERLREYAAEGVRLKADVILAVSSAAVRMAATPLPPGATLHPAQRSPCYVVEDRYSWVDQRARTHRAFLNER